MSKCNGRGEKGDTGYNGKWTCGTHGTDSSRHLGDRKAQPYEYQTDASALFAYFSTRKLHEPPGCGAFTQVAACL